MRIFLGLLLAASAFMMLRQSESAGSTNPLATAAGSAAVAGASVVSTAASRTRHAVGMGVSRMIRPGVKGMTVRTASMVTDLQPAIRRAPTHRATRARTIARQIAATDSMALHSLSEGQPVAAVRLALKSRSLVDAVRHQVAEEAMR
jgi:hypothetical protein